MGSMSKCIRLVPEMSLSTRSLINSPLILPVTSASCRLSSFLMGGYSSATQL